MTTTKRFSKPMGTLRAAVALSVFSAVLVLVPARAFADVAKFYLDCPTTEVTEGDSVDVELVRVPGSEIDSGFDANWHAVAGSASADDFVSENGVFQGSTAAEQTANRMSHTLYTLDDLAAEADETFVVSFSPPHDVADPSDSDRDAQCEITITDNDAGITGVEIISSPGRDEVYGLGEAIDIEATFNADVEVDTEDGTVVPGLVVAVGDNGRVASYSHKSASDRVVFRYRVQAGDGDTDGVSMAGGHQDGSGVWQNFVNHTAITAAGESDEDARIAIIGAYPGFEAQSGHRVSGDLHPFAETVEITSSPADGDTYLYGETIEVSMTFDVALDVTGSRHVQMNINAWNSNHGGSTSRDAVYTSGSGTETLVFAYTVQTTDFDPFGVGVVAARHADGEMVGFGGDGTITIAGSSVEVNPSYVGLGEQSGHLVNGRPIPNSISITSTPAAASDTYGRGETIEVAFDFGQSVTAGEDAVAALRFGSDEEWTTVSADYASGSGTNVLVFEYTAQTADRDDDGIQAHLWYAADIKATETEVFSEPGPNDTILVMDANSGHKINGAAPVIKAVDLIDDEDEDNVFGVGDRIRAAVVYDVSITVTGSPQLMLNVGGTQQAATYYGTAGSAVIFGYTVAAGDSDTDGVSIDANSLSLNGGTIADAEGNAAWLSHSAVVDDPEHTVSAPIGGV